MSTHSQIHGHIDRVAFYKMSTGSISLHIHVGNDTVTIFIEGEQGVLDFRRAVIDAAYELISKPLPKEAA
jgi:hypothetical protein